MSLCVWLCFANSVVEDTILRAFKQDIIIDMGEVVSRAQVSDKLQ